MNFIKKSGTLVLLASLAACSIPFEISETTVGGMSNKEICQRIVAGRGAIQGMAGEVVKPYRETVIKGFNVLGDI